LIISLKKTLLSTLTLYQARYKCDRITPPTLSPGQISIPTFSCILSTQTGTGTYDNINECNFNCPRVPFNQYTKYDNSICYDQGNYSTVDNIPENELEQRLYKLELFNSDMFNCVSYNKTTRTATFGFIQTNSRLTKDNNNYILLKQNVPVIQFSPDHQMIKTKLGINRSLDVQGNQKNGRIILYNSNNNENQRFTMDRYNRLIVYPAGNKQCLTKYLDCGNRDCIYARDCIGDNEWDISGNQKWFPDTKGRLVSSNMLGNICLGVADGNDSDGTGIISENCNDNNSQKWFVTPS
jgi:hypothetical protein